MRPPAIRLVHGPAAAEPQDRRRECRANVHCGHPADDDIPPGDRLIAREPRHEVLGDVKESRRGPGEPILPPISDCRRRRPQHSVPSILLRMRAKRKGILTNREISLTSGHGASRNAVGGVGLNIRPAHVPLQHLERPVRQKTLFVLRRAQHNRTTVTDGWRSRGEEYAKQSQANSADRIVCAISR